MRTRFYIACGAFALAATGCLDEKNISGTSTEPNTVQANGSVLWDPSNGDHRVNFTASVTALPKGAVADGHWYWEAYSDAKKGGEAYISWPTKLTDGTDSLSAVIDSCQGLCGTAVLKKGSMTSAPFAGVGFTIARDKNGEPLPVDVSNWGGVCVTYTSEADPLIVLDLGDSLKHELGDKLPSASMKKTKKETEITECVSWEEFTISSESKKLPEHWQDAVGEKAASQLVGVKIRIQDDSGKYKFNIRQVGTKENDPPKTTHQKSSSSSQAESSSSSQIASSSSWLLLGGGDGSLWTPLKDKDHVQTLLYTFYKAEDKSDKSYTPIEPDGRWFLETDAANGGESFISWPVSLGHDSSLVDVVEFCKGLCGRASLKKGTSQKDPAVYASFNLAKDSAGNRTPVSVWKWKGICVEYYSETDLSVELVLSDSLNRILDYNLPAAKLSKSSSIEKTCLSWDKFNLPEGVENVPQVLKENKHIDHDSTADENQWKMYVGSQASKHLVGVRFKIQADEGDYSFGIGAVGNLFREFKSNTDLPICVSKRKGNSCEKDLMSGGYGFPQVNTARYADDSWPSDVEEDGRWFVETDSAKGGHSSISPYDLIQFQAKVHDTLETLISECEGICRSIDLRREAITDDDELEDDSTTNRESQSDAMTDDPYVVLGFHLARTISHSDDLGDPVPVDVSNWDGMCFEYFSRIPITLELDTGDSLNTILGAKPYVILPETERHMCFRWSDFELPAGQITPEYSEGSVGEFAAKHLSAIRFIMQSHNDGDVILNIRTISTYYF
ncbi:MAG: hypothetical protein J6U20_02605 [Fibrobacter sp.]|nr:hypothetical protein [Fibrobacter sp.]